MSVKFDVQMTKKAMYNFMLYTTYTSIGGIVTVVFGGVATVLGLRQFMFGDYSAGATFFLIAAFLLIWNPVNMKIRSADQVAKSPMFQKPISYELTEEGVRISQDGQSALNEWKVFQKAVSTNVGLILYITKVRAIIFTKEGLGEQYAPAVKMISTHMPAKKVKIRHVSSV